MSILSFLLGEKKKTASVAKERLQLIIAHERDGKNINGKSCDLSALRDDLMAVISKHFKIDPKDVQVHLDHQENFEVLDVKIEMPQSK